MADNDIEYRVNLSSAQAALRSIEVAAANVGKTASKGGQEAADALAKLESAVKKASVTFESVNDRAYQSNQRYLASLEKRVALENKSGVDRLIAERDQLSKRFGQNTEQLARFNAQYQKLIELEKQSSRQGGQGGQGPGLLALRGARDLFEGRTAYGEVQLGRALSSLSGVGLAAGAAAVAIVGLSVAGYKAAESFAHWGAEQSALQQKLGLTARELAQFQFAAKASGTDINSLERAMRGVASATEDLSPAGNKAREAFAGIGFSLQDAHGKAKPFGQALQELAVAVDKLPPGTERAAFMIETLKRSGIESIPALHELANAAKEFEQQKLPFQDQQSIDIGKAMNRQLAEMEQRFDHLVLKGKEWAAIGFFGELNLLETGNLAGARSPIRGMSGSGVLARDEAADAVEVARQAAIAGPGSIAAGIALRGFGGANLEGAKAAETLAKEAMDKAHNQLQLDTANAQIGMAEVSQHTAALAATTSEYEKQKNLVKSLEEAQSRASNWAERRLSIEQETSKIQLAEKFRYGGEEGKIQQQMAEANLALNAEAFKERAVPGASAVIERNRSARMDAFNADLLDIRNRIQQEAENRVSEFEENAQKSELARRFSSSERLAQLTDLGQNPAGAIEAGYQHSLDFAAQIASVEMLGIERKQQALVTSNDKRKDSAAIQEAIAKEEYDYATKVNEAIDARTLKYAELDKQREAAEQKISDIQFEARAFDINRAASIATHMAELQTGKSGEGIAIEQGYHIRIELAERLKLLEDERIAKVKDLLSKQELSARAQKTYEDELIKAQDELALKQEELLRKQTDSIAKTAEGLYATLFKHPSKFPRQLASTASDLALHPLITGLGEMTGRVLHDPIFGASGTAGLVGASRNIFGGGRLGADASNPVWTRIVGLPEGGGPAINISGSGGSGGGGSGSGGSGVIFGGSTLPFASAFSALREIAPYLNLQFMQTASGGRGGVAGGVAGIGSPVGTPIGTATSSISYAGGEQNVGLGTGLIGGGSVSVPYDVSQPGSLSLATGATYESGGSGGGSGGSSNFNPLSLLGGGSGGGFRLPSLAALKSSFFNPNIYTGSGSAVASSSLGPLGNLAGVLTSPAAGQLETSIGLPLALAGLAGVNRGTAIGIGESTFGGALTGAGIGTMILPGIGTAIGAGVGAAVGFATSGIEDLLGIKSDRQKAIEQVRSLYHINISYAAADEIAKIARSKYGDNVSIAVRSPEVRQMLGLYAAGTGQAGKFPQSADIPLGGSLVSQGGQLQQSPVYQYGNPYTYSSSLPVAGGNPGGFLPNPGGSIAMSFNISGKSASDFMNGEVFTPEATADNIQAAYNSSAGRTLAAMTMQDPTGIVG